MARLNLRQETFDEVIELLLPLMWTEADRRGLLFWAFGNNKAVLEHLNYGGEAREFVEYLVGYLCAYGEVEPGVQALWMLLVTARDQVDEAAQQRIDAIFPTIQGQGKRERAAREASIESLYGEAEEDSKEATTRDAKGLFEDADEKPDVAEGVDVVPSLSSPDTGGGPGGGASGSAPGGGGQHAKPPETGKQKPELDISSSEPNEPGKVEPTKPKAGESDDRRQLTEEELEALYGPRGGGMEPEPSPEASPPTPPALATEDVRFTAYFPRQVAVKTWYSLLVYAYIEKALEKVRADAAKFKNELGLMPREMHSRAPAQLTRGTEIVITPVCEGLVFNPETITIRWLEDFHRAEFRFKAGQDVAGMASNGLISISVGPVIIASIKMAFLFEDPAEIPAGPPSTPAVQEVTTQVYKQDQIFLSYSHTDTAIVVACRNAYKSLGFKPLIDIDELRSGENWNDELMRMIDRADIFQLFWSARSSQSKYVQQEWEYALKKAAATRGEGFIRPVYWEKPLVNPPDALGHLHFGFMTLAKLDES